METVHLEKHVAFEPNQPIEYAYFPLTGIASMLTVMKGGKAVEVATIGNEGMVGLPLFLGVNITPSQAFTQVPGDSIRIKAGAFQKEVGRQGGFAKMLRGARKRLASRDPGGRDSCRVASSAICNPSESIR